MGCSKVVQLSDSGSTEWITRCEVPLQGAKTGPLQGLTFAAKDNIDAQGLPTTAACPSFAYVPAEHAQVVRRLLEAGACLAGKTNLDQFACGLNGTRSPYGAVPNAFDARYVSGGSSSGSAFAVATGQVDFALGTDTAGSGRVPAGLNNIVGLKPSKGLISARGVVPAAQSVDCVSILTREVGLAVDVLKAAMGEDDLDPFSRSLTLSDEPWPAEFQFGVPDVLEFFGDVQAQVAFEQAVDRMKSLGGQPVSVNFAPFAQAASLLYESALVAERYEAIQHFFDAHPDDVVEPVRTIIGQGRQYSAADLFRAQTLLKALDKQTQRAWEHMDVMLVPTAPTHYTIDAMQADPLALNRNLGTYTNFVNLLDYAALSIPSSIRPDGLPFGITLIGRCGSDLRLADLGQRYHLATGLTQGRTSTPLSPAKVILPGAGKRWARVAVVGAHLSGMPLNGQLTERGGRLLEATQTSADYRLFALSGTVPPKPGLLRGAPHSGQPIDVELWELPMEHYGSFVSLIPAPLGIGTLTLLDGRQVQGFVCEPQALQDALDVTSWGGWRAYLQSRS
ncbi:MAG: allophanate hydrolase [Pseudomonadota bacterium]